MKTLFSSLLTATAVAALVPAVAFAQQAPAKAGAMSAAESALTKPIVAKTAPRNSDGHADLTGTWTNVSITQLERSPQFGVRKALSKEEAARLEGQAVDRFVEGNKPTPQDVGSLDNTESFMDSIRDPIFE
ncbi:MAG: hypothetical protein EOP20_04885 [Hyphomicrobiales bacterium]|nr:MAG: hypothetical protein EOP20_04885 [Hyphomicrobiales bacterium]